jgi:hypothetical protein
MSLCHSGDPQVCRFSGWARPPFPCDNIIPQRGGFVKGFGQINL